MRQRPENEATAVESRPRLPDPGKLVLASTKDFAHRIYLSRGIYAEVTLQYRHRRWEHHEYTFPDYRREDYQRFSQRMPGEVKIVASGEKRECRLMLPLTLTTGFHVLANPRLHDSEHGRLLGGGAGRATLGAAMGTGRSAGPSQGPRRAHAHQRRTGHLAGNRAAAGRGATVAVGAVASAAFS